MIKFVADNHYTLQDFTGKQWNVGKLTLKESILSLSVLYSKYAEYEKSMERDGDSKSFDMYLFHPQAYLFDILQIPKNANSLTVMEYFKDDPYLGEFTRHHMKKSFPKVNNFLLFPIYSDLEDSLTHFVVYDMCSNVLFVYSPFGLVELGVCDTFSDYSKFSKLEIPIANVVFICRNFHSLRSTFYSKIDKNYATKFGKIKCYIIFRDRFLDDEPSITTITSLVLVFFNNFLNNLSNLQQNVLSPYNYNVNGLPLNQDILKKYITTKVFGGNVSKVDLFGALKFGVSVCQLYEEEYKSGKKNWCFDVLNTSDKSVYDKVGSLLPNFEKYKNLNDLQQQPSESKSGVLRNGFFPYINTSEWNEMKSRNLLNRTNLRNQVTSEVEIIISASRSVFLEYEKQINDIQYIPALKILEKLEADLITKEYKKRQSQKRITFPVQLYSFEYPIMINSDFKMRYFKYYYEAILNTEDYHIEKWIDARISLIKRMEVENLRNGSLFKLQKNVYFIPIKSIIMLISKSMTLLKDVENLTIKEFRNYLKKVIQIWLLKLPDDENEWNGKDKEIWNQRSPVSKKYICNITWFGAVYHSLFVENQQ